ASIDAAAWRQLAADIAHTGAAPLLELAQRNRLTEITIHSSLHARLRGLLLDSPDTIVRAEWAGVPWLLRRLMEFALVDPAGAAALARLGIVTVADLDGALQDGRVATHLASYQDRLRIAVDALSFERPRVPLGRAVDLVDNFIRLVAAACPDVQRLTPAGDVRRFEPLVESLVVVASAADPQGCLDAVSAISAVQSVLHRTSRRAIVSYQHTEMDIRIAAADEFGTALHVATGSHTHIGSMRTRQGGARLCAREEDVYSLAGLAWIPPEIRQGTGEIEAAGNGTLPALVAREHIRGDLHMHTTYSDGRDSLAEMVQAGAALGYEYIAITDHSERAGASRTVSTNALARQRREIVRLRARFPAMAILHGIEVDIMPDGSLD
ncbi:MAG: PHP domain-containing protein, partial [Longimicrobiales bacterium]